MKKLIFSLSIIVFTHFCWSQKVSRPMLLFTPERINKAKGMLEKEAKMTAGWDVIKRKADDALTKKDLLQTDYLALAYQMTGDLKYAAKVKDILMGSIRGKQWASTDEMMLRKPAWRADLGLSQKCRVSALAFDGIYDYLTESERKEIAKGLYAYGVVPSLGDWLLEPTRIHSLNSMGHNWWTSCTCMGGLLALSISNEVPEAGRAASNLYEHMPEWFAFAGDVLQNKPKSFDANGGMYESINYANFGTSEALLFLVAWQNTHPKNKLPLIPELWNTPEFFIYCSYKGDSGLSSLNFGDSATEITAENTLMLLIALGKKDDNMLWYLRQAENGHNREGFYRNTPIGFLYYPDTAGAPEVPDLQCSQLFADFGWATMRSSWSDNTSMLAVKSGHTWNHSHADANSFVVYHKGENLITDGGHCWYPSPAYREYFFQSAAHNVVLFEGEGQPENQQYEGSMLDGSLSDLIDAGTIKYVLANGTGPYANHFIRNFRHFLWIDNIIYVVDDLKTYKTGTFEWLWHFNGTVTKTGLDLNVKYNDATLAVRPLYPEYLTPSNFVHDYPTFMQFKEKKAPSEDLKGETTYYSVKYPVNSQKLKGLTSIVLKESDADAVPKMEKIQGKDWIGVRVHNKGKVTDLIINQLADGSLMHSNSWIWAEGWETDSYMFAVTYPEGETPDKATEFAILYGSALRRDGISYFSSLSKLFVIRQNQGNSIKIQIKGQPLINADFYNITKPKKLFVNTKETPAEYIDEHFSVKLDLRE